VTDDVQWLSSEDEVVFKNGFSYHDSFPLVYVLCFRDGEALPEMVPPEDKVETIRLENLKLCHVEELVKDTLGGVGLPDMSDFLDYVMQETSGNPHQLKTLLRLCHETEDIVFDWGRQEWTFKRRQSNATSLKSAEWVDFVAQQNPSASELLFAAAVITDNGTFVVALLKHLCPEMPSQELDRLLYRFEETYGLIRQVTATNASTGRKNTTQYRFMHDLYQTASFALVEKSRRPNLLWHIGTSVLNATGLSPNVMKSYAVCSIGQRTLAKAIDLGYEVNDSERRLFIETNLKVAEDYVRF
jgi:hypothetical protein